MERIQNQTTCIAMNIACSRDMLKCCNPNLDFCKPICTTPWLMAERALKRQRVLELEEKLSRDLYGPNVSRAAGLVVKGFFDGKLWLDIN